MASAACCAHSPSVRTVTVVPCAAASIKTPMMLFPLTFWPSFSSCTSQGNLLAVDTIIAAGRAWSPILLRTVHSLTTLSSAIPLPELEEPGAKRKAEQRGNVRRSRHPQPRQEGERRHDGRGDQEHVERPLRQSRVEQRARRDRPRQRCPRGFQERG